jgi:hypothetical protein
MTVLAGDIVDWTALGKVVLASLAAGVGVALFFSFAVLGATRFVDMRRHERSLEAVFYGALAVAGLAATLGSIVAAIVVMTNKS